jgi:GTP1/Obg family GTP-binding protein
MSLSRTPTLAELDEQLDAELERVQHMTEDFQKWTHEQRSKIEIHRQKQLRSGEVGLTEYNSIIHSLESLNTVPPETIDYLLKTFDLLAHT